MRKRVYEIIELSSGADLLSSIYDFFMMAVIVASLIPLAFKGTTPFFRIVESAAAYIFVADYVLRLCTADLKLKRGGGVFCYLPVHANGNH